VPLTWYGGERITAAKLNARLPIYVPKSVAETVTSSTTLQDDDELVVTLSAGRSYDIELVLAVTTGTTGADVKLAWATTGTVTQTSTRACFGPGRFTKDAAAETSNTASPYDSGMVRASRHNLTTSVAYGTDGSTASAILEKFTVSGGVSGGTLRLQWAQNVSSATATTVSTSSYLRATPVD
jgi:hypothetical protein